MAAIIGHEVVRRTLRSLAESEAPPHALMLVGPARTGRTLLALELAALLNCEAEAAERACGECRACRLITEGAHPDVLRLEPGDSFCRGESGHERHPRSRDIRICQIRGLIETVSRYPFEGRYRVIVVEPADRMGLEAANTLLKTLEEPPPQTVIVLVTAAPEALLVTIRSRCRALEVGLVPREAIREGLLARDFGEEIAERAALESRRRPADAIAFAEHPDLMDDRGRLLERCAGLAAGGAVERMSYANDLADRWRRDRELVLAELEAWDTFWETRLREGVSDAEDDPKDALTALQAIGAARDDLEAQVVGRMALELMLLRFPTVRLSEATVAEPSENGHRASVAAAAKDESES